MALTSASYIATETIETETRPLSWGAIFAGAVAALSAHLLITLFAVGLGIQVVDINTVSEPLKKATLGVGVAWSVSALLSLWIGGWVAGRFSPGLSRRGGALHGALVWALATVVTAFAFTGGAGLLAGAAAAVTGKAASSAGKAVATVVAPAGQDFVSDFANQNSNLLGGYVRELVPGSAADAAEQSPEVIRQTRELTWGLVRFFTLEDSARNADAKAALARTIAQNSDLNETEARARVEEIVASYNQVQNDLKALADRAEVKARQVAEEAATYVTHTAVWTFLAFVIGAVAASAAGSFGAKARITAEVGTPQIN